MRLSLNVAAILVFIFGVVSSLHAEWVVDGAVVCSDPQDQTNPWVVAADGAGGVIIVWADYRNSNWDIYAQKVDASGDTLWVKDGIHLCAAVGDQTHPRAIPVAAGGAIVIWRDMRGSDMDVYAQKVDSDGNIQWTIDGAAVCTAINNQDDPELTSDGAGGAIVVWRDFRYDPNYRPDIYAQRVDASGISQWGSTEDCVAICTVDNTQNNPTLISDGVGGAFMVWQDYRDTGSYPDIFAQRVDSDGGIHSGWPVNGIGVCDPAASSRQVHPQIISDDAGGAIITWADNRSGNYNIYAHRINGSGVKQWSPSDGVILCSATGDQDYPFLVTDGSGGAIVTWRDNRTGVLDIYSQRIDSGGGNLWTANGEAVCTSTGEQTRPRIVVDGEGGAVIVWQDGRGGDYDIYAQRIDMNGAVQWDLDGIAMSAAAGDQQRVEITLNSDGAVVVAWDDDRGGNYDIYAQKRGLLPECQVYPSDFDFGIIDIGEIIDTTFTITNVGGDTVFCDVNEACNQHVILSGADPCSLTAGQSLEVILRFAPTVPGTYNCTVETGSGLCSDVSCTGIAVEQLSYGWPMFHHDLGHTGRSVSIAPYTSDTAWTYETGGAVSSSPAVYDGRIYVGSDDENVYCLDAVTGDLIWTYTTGGDVRSSPAIYEDKVYVGSGYGMLYCLDALNGDSLWSFEITSYWNVTSPALYDGKAYISSWDTLYCLDATTGSRIWIKDWIMNYFNNPPAVYDGNIYIGGLGYGGITCLNAETGGHVWDYETGGATITSPAIDGGRVYLGTTDSLLCLDASNGDRIWGIISTTIRSTPAVVDGKVYCGTEIGEFICLDALTGEFIWECVSIGGVGRSSPAVADGKIYVGSYDGILYCLPQDDPNGDSNLESYEMVWRYTTGDSIDSSPAIANGMLYVGSNDNKIYAFESAPLCHISPDSLYFGTVDIGDLLDLTFTITNIGGDTLTGNVSESCDEFSIISGGGAYSLSAGQSNVVTVRFAPTVSGTFNCSVETGSILCDSVPCVGTGEETISYGWPMFQHDLSNTGYTISSAPDTNDILWTYNTGGDVHSSPAVYGGKVYVGSDDHNVYCLDAESGDLIWTYATGGEVQSSPAVYNGKVYVGSWDYNIYCLDAENGDSLWAYTTGLSILRSSPAVFDGMVYIGSLDGIVYCLDAENGDSIWTYNTTTGGVTSSPAIFDGRVYVGSTNNNIYCLDASNGDSIWTYTTSGELHSSPAVIGGKVYVGTSYKVYCLDAGNGDSLWAFPEGTYGSPAVACGKVYFGSSFDFYCVDAETGYLSWSKYWATNLDASPALADGKVFAGEGVGGEIICMDDSNGDLIWYYPMGGGDEEVSSPAVAYGNVYVGGGSKVYAFGLPEAPEEGDPAFYVDAGEDTRDVVAGETICWAVNPTNFGFVSGGCTDMDTFCVHATDTRGWSITGNPPLEECTVLDHGYSWWQNICISVPCDVDVCDYDTLIIVMAYCDENLICQPSIGDCEDPNWYAGNPYYSADTVVLHVVESPPMLVILQDSIYCLELGMTAAYVPFTVCNSDICDISTVYDYIITSTGHIGGGFPQSGSTSAVPGGECDDVYGIMNTGVAYVCDLDTLTIIAWDAATGTVYDTCVQIVHVVEPLPVPLFTAPVAAALVIVMILTAAVMMKRQSAGRVV